VKAKDRFKKLAEETDGPDEFARKGCDEGLFVSMSQGRRIHHSITRTETANNATRHKGPSALKQAGWGGLAQ